ncbi:ADP-ribosylglycohydrolase family protein [Arthrobacter sp. zg-Y750]|uniref:ADP-ribosylglycohydrolase family protein n=1 Tax=Arthrobacter sp. zg-Y750 TaxID=2894189 RepID=UPI001E58D384|nr:ADP-ribosylglycohydrolase family protein [Arthrobacter sp. zg-Y750]MCC9176822.1 ADP-ribosylglycohydrolase family protein [Arthrobacter sp. zg-Y750]
MYVLQDRVAGVLAGAAVGDALGGATEGWTPEQIQERHGGRVEGIVGPFLADWRTARPIAPFHKGDGHVTDDTLMTHALVEVYAKRRRHLDAYDVAADLVPLMIGERRWVPELEDHALILQRVFLAEKWLVAKLHYGHADPREAGVGNIVNCGAAMYMAPVGLVHIGDPRGAYAEAIDIAGAHQSSYGREAAGVFAAAVAAAAAPGAAMEDVRAAVLGVAHDGTAAAIRAVFDAVDAFTADGGDPCDVARVVRAAVAPYDTVGEQYRAPAMDARLPSRTKSIEELPAALGFALARGGDLRAAVLDAVNYGRDADSIATMAGAVCGGLHGIDAVPADWVADVTAASRLDLDAVVTAMTETVREVARADLDRAARRTAALQSLLSREEAR